MINLADFVDNHNMITHKSEKKHPQNTHRGTQASEELPSHSAVVARQMNADPALVAEFLRRQRSAISHLMISEPLPKIFHAYLHTADIFHVHVYA